MKWIVRTYILNISQSHLFITEIHPHGQAACSRPGVFRSVESLFTQEARGAEVRTIFTTQSSPWCNKYVDRHPLHTTHPDFFICSCPFIFLFMSYTFKKHSYMWIFSLILSWWYTVKQSLCIIYSTLTHIWYYCWMMVPLMMWTLWRVRKCRDATETEKCKYQHVSNHTVNFVLLCCAYVCGSVTQSQFSMRVWNVLNDGECLAVDCAL